LLVAVLLVAQLQLRLLTQLWAAVVVAVMLMALRQDQAQQVELVIQEHLRLPLVQMLAMVAVEQMVLIVEP
jgi:hypothetical protein